MIRASSHLLCTMVVGSALWGCVVVLFACSRLSINFKVTRDMTIDCLSRSDSMDPRVVREVIDSRPTNHTTLDKYAHEIFTQPRNPSSLTSMCTMVMLTYRRERVLTFLLNHYCKVRSLHKIIIIWNDVDRSIPDDIVDIRDDCVTELLFIREKKNKLTNRFKPRPEIETECVCIIDDDRFIVDLRDLEFGFNVWQSFRHRIVGFEHRTHVKLANGSFWYDMTDFSRPRLNYSMILTSTAILHKAYLEMFFDDNVLPRGMIDYIDERKNCEDIALNVMVAKFLEDLGQSQAAALAVKPKREVRNMDHSMNRGSSNNSANHQGLSSLPDHYVERSRCLNDFRDMYGGILYLPYTTLIVDNMAVRFRPTKHNRTHSVRFLNSTVARTLLARNSTFHGHLYPWKVSNSSNLYLRRNQSRFYSWKAGNISYPYVRRNQSHFYHWKTTGNVSRPYSRRLRNKNMIDPLEQSEKLSSKGTHKPLQLKPSNGAQSAYKGTSSKVRIHSSKSLRSQEFYHNSQDQQGAAQPIKGQDKSLVRQSQSDSD